ncbi:hypothetical protein [Pseudoxanthomonas mexicana]|uniref:hypothetical protein n=1 Tax=Pseudoxanthomonas mexicana TaxID=128785 RepID=UPI000780F80F|nr:hypothetical protein [Pseudoxanthomonas mexicana]
MRKPGKVGLWLVLMASVSVPLPALAQEGPPPEVPGRVESDPQLAAASKAWHDVWRANVETHLRSIAARGTPRDLLVAGWLWPMQYDEAGRPEAASWRLARGWVQAAYAASRGDDPLVDWALLNACAKTDAGCDREVLLERLAVADPGNAEPLLTHYSDAVQRNDTVSAERYWQAATSATRYRSRANETGLLMAEMLRQVPMPPLDPALAAAIGEDFMLGRAATPHDMPDVVVMAMHAATAIPTLHPLTQRCRAQVGQLPADTLSACKRIHTLLADDTSTLLFPAIALPRLVEWADTDAERDAARERLRRFAWVYERTMQLYQRPADTRRMPEDYIDVFLRDGELAAMRRQLEANGIATLPPAGWQPDNPQYRAALTGSPAATR